MLAEELKEKLRNRRNKMTQKDVRYFYLRDPKNQKRSMCVVRKLDRETDTVHFQFSCNHPTLRKGGVVLDKGDVYSKKKGRMIAEGRLMKDPFVLKLNGRKPFKAIIEVLATWTEDSLNDLRMSENMRYDDSYDPARINRPLPTSLRKAAKTFLSTMKEEKVE